MANLLDVRIVVIGLVAVLSSAGLLFGLNLLLSLPSEAEATEIVYGELLHYEEFHGDPHVVYEHRGRIYFDHLKRDYKYLLSPDSPGWVITGLQYFIPVTDEPASVGVARCTGILGEECAKSTEIFGQISVPEITTLEVEYGDEWHRFPVSEPGFSIRLDGFKDAPTGYRWLDEDDQAIHREGSIAPLTPGR